MLYWYKSWCGDFTFNSDNISGWSRVQMRTSFFRSFSTWSLWMTSSKIKTKLHNYLICQVVMVVTLVTSHNQALYLRTVCPLIQSSIFLFKIINPLFLPPPFFQKSCWLLKCSAVQVKLLLFSYCLGIGGYLKPIV